MPLARDIRLNFRTRESEYKASGLWGNHLTSHQQEQIHKDISEAAVLSSFGVIHHTDNTLSQKDILIPLCRNANKYWFKRVDHSKETRELRLDYLEPVLFNPKEFHSLAPYGFPSKLPLIFVTLTIPDSIEAKIQDG
jgi:hypothetical protein